jgi:hypothetical protein
MIAFDWLSTTSLEKMVAVGSGPPHIHKLRQPSTSGYLPDDGRLADTLAGCHFVRIPHAQ